jgi:hypothetical protein
VVLLSAPPKETPFFGRNGRINDVWVAWFGSITATATIVQNLQTLNVIAEDNSTDANMQASITELLDALALVDEPRRAPAALESADADGWRAECGRLREEVAELRALVVAGDPAPLGALGSAAWSDTSAFDAAGAAAAAVAAIPNASSTATGLLKSADWSTFNAKQAALGYTPENVANKGAASGYAPLDGSTLLPVANLPTVPITKGGTGATTAGAGLSNLGGASLSSSNTLTGTQTLTFTGATNGTFASGRLSVQVGSDATLGPLMLNIGGMPSATGTARYITISAGDNLAMRPLALNANGFGSFGPVLIGTVADNAVDKLQVVGGASISGLLKIGSAAPATSGAAGTAGALTWDANFLYLCVAANSWRRIALTTF